MGARLAIGVAAVGLVLAGCSGSPAAAPPPSPAQPVTAIAATKPTPMKIGEPVPIYDDVTEVGRVTFTSVEVDPTCEPNKAYPVVPSPGHHFVAVFAEVTTGAGVMANGIPAMTSDNFVEVTPDGYTNTTLLPTGYGMLCLDDRPHVGSNYYAPHSKYKDAVTLETQGASGTLIYQPNSAAPRSIAFPQSDAAPASMTTTPPKSTTVQAPVPATPRAPAPTTMEYTPPPLPNSADCPPGTVFSPLGPDSCVSPQQKAQTEDTEAQCGGGNGPVSLCGPQTDPAPKTPSTVGCGAKAMAAGKFDPSCPEYQGYLDPGESAGRAPSSGDIQRQYAKEQCAAGVMSFC